MITETLLALAAALLAQPATPGSDPSKSNPLSHPAPADVTQPAAPSPAPRTPPPTTPPVQPPPPQGSPLAPAVQTSWPEEAPFLSGQVQLTFPSRFAKAGEAYFDHFKPPRWIIFQAVPVPPEGQEPSPNYLMYVAKLRRDAGGAIIGIEEPILLSSPESANTCGWFVPQSPGAVIFGSTVTKPQDTSAPGFSRDRQRYMWQFPTEMQVMSTSVYEAMTDLNSSGVPLSIPARSTDIYKPSPLFNRPGGYTAECSWSSDHRHVVYTHVDEKTRNPDIWVWDQKDGKHTPLVNATGYNGGPFFSPDGKRICYRSDRKGNNVLQLYIADLAFGDPADPQRITGITAEHQITFEDPSVGDEQQHVSWCPFWHPSGDYMVYATSAVGHNNYEVFAIETDTSKPVKDLRRARVTYAEGFDGLPVFSDDGALMMWTSQRGPRLPNEKRPSSQVWVARVQGGPTWGWKPAPAANPPIEPTK